MSLTRRAFGAAVLFAPAIARAAQRVRIGHQKNGSLVILNRQRRLEAIGLQPEWVEFTSGPPLLEALGAGAIDVGATGDTPPIFAQAAGSELLYVGAQPVTGRTSAVLVRANSPVREPKDLAGKRVAFTKGSSAHNFTVKLLESIGLKLSDIEPVFLQPADAGAAFRTGALDAWTIWDPFFAIAEAEPTTRVLTTAEGVAPTNSFFLASRAFATREPETVNKLLDAINGAAAWASANSEDLARTLADVTGVPLPAQRVAAWRGVYAVQKLDDAIIAQQQGIADTFTRLHMIPARIDVRAAVWQAKSREASR